ncbi:hypothetical protein V2J09_012447 [Rumex salicifolius]
MATQPHTTTVTKFDIDKFDGKISFSIWRVQMKAVLTQNGLKKALESKAKMPAGTTDEQWTDLDERALSAIQLCLSREVLREVIHEETAAGLWSKLESLYMTKSLANKIRLKEKMFTLRMKEGSDLQAHLNEFSSILIDLENLDIKMEDEDKAVLLICSLPSSYKHFKEIMLYGNNSDCLCLEDVKSNLLAKEKFDVDKDSESNAEGLYAKGRNGDKPSKNKSKFRPKPESKYKGSNNNSKSCKYCKKAGHDVSECFKLKNKKESQKQGQSSDQGGQSSHSVNSCTDGDLLLVDHDSQDTKTEWIIDSGCTFHMCPHKNWFQTYEPVHGSHVLLGDNTPCPVLGKGTIKTRTQDGVERTLSEVRHIPELRRNLISLGTLEARGYKYNGEDGVLKVFKGSMRQSQETKHKKAS